MRGMKSSAAQDLAEFLGGDRYSCLLADPPWRFQKELTLIWPKQPKNGGSGRRGKNTRALAPGRRQMSVIGTRKPELSGKPDWKTQCDSSRLANAAIQPRAA